MGANRDVTGGNARGLGRKLLQRGKQAKAIVEIGAVLAAPPDVSAAGEVT